MTFMLFLWILKIYFCVIFDIYVSKKKRTWHCYPKKPNDFKHLYQIPGLGMKYALGIPEPVPLVGDTVSPEGGADADREAPAFATPAGPMGPAARLRAAVFSKGRVARPIQGPSKP
jgi:hypothetical protein